MKPTPENNNARWIYLILEGSSSFFMSLIFTVNLVYQAAVVGLSPLQLVLVGTTLELAIFLGEIPTGILADLKSRKWSVVLGYFLIGVGFWVEVLTPAFWAVALGQCLWGIGYTFTSGATEAWVADELGEATAGRVFLEGARLGQWGALLAILPSVLIGRYNVVWPVRVGSVLLIGLSFFLAVTMREHGFKPTPPDERSNWHQMGQQIKEMGKLTRQQLILWWILAITLFYGLYSEGFDRLWTAHFLENFATPWADVNTAVIWFGVLRGVGMVLSIIALSQVEKRVDVSSSRHIGRTLPWVAGGIVLALLLFAVTGSFWTAVACYWLIGVLRRINSPLHTAWLNLHITNSQLRATLFSANSLVDALGQIGGGPVVGWVGNIAIRAALALAALLLSPVLFLYYKIDRWHPVVALE